MTSMYVTGGGHDNWHDGRGGTKRHLGLYCRCHSRRVGATGHAGIVMSPEKIQSAKLVWLEHLPPKQKHAILN